MASIEPDSAQIAWYIYDMAHGAGVLTRQLCADLITGGPVKVFRKKATDDYTGWAVWGCSPVLGRLAIERPEIFAGKRVLELGAGCGVAGLAVACCTKAASLCISDFPVETLRNTLHNVALNCERTVADAGASSISTELGGVQYGLGDTFVARGSSCTVTLAQLDWEAESTWPVEPGMSAVAGAPAYRQYDILLAADVLPREGYGTKVAFVTRHLLRPGGLFIAVTPAARYGRLTLEEGLHAAGFSVASLRPGGDDVSTGGGAGGGWGADGDSVRLNPSHELVPDDWRRNPLRRPLSEAARGGHGAAAAAGSSAARVAAEALAAIQELPGGPATLAEEGISEAVAAGAAAGSSCGACSHAAWFGGAARAAAADALAVAASGDCGEGPPPAAAAAAAATALAAALARAGGAGSLLRLVSDAAAEDMFPEMARPDYDILIAAFQAPQP